MTRKLLASAALATSLLAAGCSSSGQAMAGSSGAMSGSPTAMSTGAMTPTAMSTDAMPTGAMSSGAMSTGAMTAHGSYVTLADYTAAMTSYNGTTVVYYFSSASCAVCQQKDAGLMSNPGTIPAKVTIVKVDFDASTELKQKYGVAAQDTFVQVDSTGTKVMTWSGKPVSDVLMALKG